MEKMELTYTKKNKKPLGLGVMVSGRGRNLAAIIDAIKIGIITNSKINIVVSSSEKAYALEVARINGLKSKVVLKNKYVTPEEYDEKILKIMIENDVDLIVLAGFLHILGEKIINKFEKKIINIHPSLIPAFSGAGMYGLKVHEAALEKGVKISGATVHYVNNIPDDGEIIFQKAVNVMPGDTAKTLQKRVMEEAEHILLPLAIEKISNEKFN